VYKSIDSGYNSYSDHNTMYASPRANTGFAGHSAGGFAETGEALVSSVDKVTFVGSTADPGHMNLLLAQFS